MVMSPLKDARSRLLSASSPPEIIDAAWEAFECIWFVADEFAGQVTGSFAAWVTCGSPACEGQHALGRALSMAAAARPGMPPGIAGVSEDEAARLVGALAATLEERLGAAARQADLSADAQACQRAAGAAAEIRGLFAGA
jgi:hypothetical protein